MDQKPSFQHPLSHLHQLCEIVTISQITSIVLSKNIVSSQISYKFEKLEIKKQSSVKNAELYAILQAIKWAYKLTIANILYNLEKTIWIFSDSINAIKGLSISLTPNLLTSLLISIPPLSRSTYFACSLSLVRARTA